jgi:hypothetical protein
MIPAQNRKGSMSIISPTQKAAGASSGETQNTRLISSGSHIVAVNLNKTASNIGQNVSTTKTGKGSKKNLGTGQNATKQSKID